MDALPFIDEHAVRVDAAGEAAWAALVAVLGRGGRGGGVLARMLGCEPARGTSEFAGRPGDAVPGFRVAEAERGRRLVLRGRHRFADYAPTFLLDRDRLAARTRADFPGLRGRLYRAVVIGSGAHRLVTRSI